MAECAYRNKTALTSLGGIVLGSHVIDELPIVGSNSRQYITVYDDVCVKPYVRSRREVTRSHVTRLMV